MNSLNGPGSRGLRAAIFRQPLVSTSTARRRPQPEERPEWTVALWVRRNPGVAAWVLLLIAVGLVVWPQTGVSLAKIFSNEMEERARRVVADVLDVVGSPVVIDAVEVEDRSFGIAATYSWSTRTITVSPFVDSYDEDEFLMLVCHEVVHAMFHQMDWSSIEGSANWRSFLLSEETAAEVLGAHLAGRVRSRRGGHGQGLTERLVRQHRILCDTQSPYGMYHQFARARDEFGLHAVNEEWEYVIFTHVGSVETVDDMDRICRENPDPWEAVRVIGEQYLFTDPEVVMAAKGSSAGR